MKNSKVLFIVNLVLLLIIPFVAFAGLFTDNLLAGYYPFSLFFAIGMVVMAFGGIAAHFLEIIIILAVVLLVYFSIIVSLLLSYKKNFLFGIWYIILFAFDMLINVSNGALLGAFFDIFYIGLFILMLLFKYKYKHN